LGVLGLGGLGVGTDWTGVVMTQLNGLGLRGDGVLEMWGSNGNGQFGLGAGGGTVNVVGSLPTGLQRSLVGFWPMDGNARDGGGRGLDGSPVFMFAGANRLGGAGKASVFLGVQSSDSFVDFGSPTDLKLQGDLSVGVWVRAASSGNDPSPRVMSYSGSGGWELSGTKSAGKINFQFVYGGSGVTTSVGYTMDEWHHVCVVKSGWSGEGVRGRCVGSERECWWECFVHGEFECWA